MAIKPLHTAHTPTSLRQLTNSQLLKKRTLTTNLQRKANGLCRLEVVHMLSKSYAFCIAMLLSLFQEEMFARDILQWMLSQNCVIVV